MDWDRLEDRCLLSVTEQFAISVPSTVTAGEAFPITLTAEVYGTTTPDTSYTGKVHFTSTDPNAVLPMDFTFAAANKGVVTLIGAFESTNAGQTITVVDVANPANTRISNPASLINPNSDTITVSVPSTSIAGDAVPIVVTAFNGGAPDPNYVGTVKFSSTDPTAILPGTYTFEPYDKGSHTFTGAFEATGTQTVTATDVGQTSITATSNGDTVTAPDHLVISIAPPAPVAGAPSSITVQALTPGGQIDPAYTGTLHFSSSDSSAVMPADYAFNAADAGTHTFSATFNGTGTQSLTAADAANGAISGDSGTFNVASADHFVITPLPSSTTAGAAINNITVTAVDAQGNPDPGYTGTVHFTSSDSQAVLPADATLTAGTGTFSVTFKTAGVQSLAVADTVNAFVYGQAAGTTVNPGTASRYVLELPPSTTPGQAFSMTAVAEDGYGNATTNIPYNVTISFGSSDPSAILPTANSYTFTPTGGDSSHTFTATLQTPGAQTITLYGNGLGSGAKSISVTTVDNWTGAGSDGDWNNPANWDKGLPTTYSQVVIPSGAIVTDSSTTIATIYGLDVASGAVLNITGPGGGINVQGGNAAGTAIATVDGTVNIGSPSGGAGSTLTVGNYAGLLTGGGTVFFNNDADGYVDIETRLYYTGNKLNVIGTIDSGITVEGYRGAIGPSNGSAALINKGTIAANEPGGTITVNFDAYGYLDYGAVFVYGPNDGSNSGTMEAANGGTLVVGAWGTSFTNTGTLSADGVGSTLDVGSAVDTARGAVSHWSSPGGTIQVINDGTLGLGGVFQASVLSRFTRDGSRTTTELTKEWLDGDLVLNDALGTWYIMGGGLADGTFSIAVGSTAELVATQYGGNLNNETLASPIVMSAGINGSTVAQLAVLNGLTLDTTLYLGNADGSVLGELVFQNTENLEGVGTIIFGGSGRNYVDMYYADTIGSGITIEGDNGIVGLYYNAGIINDGRIDANVPGGNILVMLGYNGTNNGTIEATNGASVNVEGGRNDGQGTLVNNGTISISGGGMLIIDSGNYANQFTAYATNGYATYGNAWTNPGTISVTGSTLYLGGSFTQEGLEGTPGTGHFVRDAASTVYLAGEINGGLALNAELGTWTSSNGTLNGGTFSTSDGAQLSPRWLHLNAVTLDDPISFPASVSSSAIYVSGGLTLNNLVWNVGQTPGAVGIWFDGTETLGGTGSIIFNNNYNGLYNNWVPNGNNSNSNPAVLTIGPNVTISAQSLSINATDPYNALSNYPTGFEILNQGTIQTDGTGHGIAIADNITNDGTLAAQNGGVINFNVAAAVLTNAGAVSVDGTSTLSTVGTFMQTAGTTTVLGTLTSTANPISIDGGTVIGSGTIKGNVINAGTLVVGDPSTDLSLAINGNYTQTTTGILDATLDGTTAGAGLGAGGYSQLNVSNAVTLDGSLDVTLAAGYAPGPNDTYLPVLFASKTGDFATESLPPGYAATYDPTDLRLAPAQTGPIPGIAAWWPGNGNTIDVIGGDNGTLVNGASYAAGEVGQAFAFNGHNQYMTAPDEPALNPASAITVEAWVTATATGNYAFFINKFDHVDGTQVDDSYDLGIEPNGALRWQLETVSGGGGIADNILDASPPVSIFDGRFHHIAGTYDGSVMKYYFDGELIASRAASGAIHASTTPILLGAAYGGNPNLGTIGYYLNGQVDEAAIYNRALTATEIGSIFAAGSAGKEGLHETAVWTGAGGDNLWTDGANWVGGVAPVAGDDLVFPANASDLTISNNFAPGTVFHSITFTGNAHYKVSGNAVTLEAGITCTDRATVDFSLDITLSASLTVACNEATLNLLGAVNLGTYSLTVDGNGTTAIDGVISGTGGLTMTGSGVLKLYGANSYSGGTLIEGGVVLIGSDTALGVANGDTTVYAGASLCMTGGISVTENLTLSGNGFGGMGALHTIGGLVDTWSGTIVLAADCTIATATASDTLVINAVISGTGGLTIIGDGTIELFGANIYDGVTLIESGIVVIGNGAALGSTIGDTTVYAGATLCLTGGISVHENLTLYGEGVGGLGALQSIGGAINSWYGTITLAADSAIASLTVNDTLWIYGAIDLGTFTLTVCGAGVSEIDGVISGSGGLTMVGTGTLRLFGANIYDGVTLIESGIVVIGNGTALGSTVGGTTVDAGATLCVTGGISVRENITLYGVGNGAGALQSIGSAVNRWYGSITLGASSTIASLTVNDTLWIYGNVYLDTFTLTCCGAGIVELDGVISGTGGLTMIGSGVLKLYGANSYSGGTLIEGGVVLIGSNTALGVANGFTTVYAGASLCMTGGITVTENLTLSGNGFGGMGALHTIGGLVDTWSGTIVLAADCTIASATLSDTLVIDAVISGPGGLTIIGAGTIELFGANTYAGVTVIESGIVLIGNGAALGSTVGGTTVYAGATLCVTGGISVYENITLYGAGNGAGALQSIGVAANFWYGTITLGADSAIASLAVSAALWIEGNVDLGAYTLTCCGVGIVEIDGVVSGTGGLTMTGSGVLKLYGANSYSGGTLIESGVVLIGSDTALGVANGITTVYAGASLCMTGGITVTENLTLSGNGFGGMGALHTIGGLVDTWCGTIVLAADCTIATAALSDTLVIDAVISGPGGLTIIGAGTIELFGVNTYLGTTVVSAGMLLVDGSQGGSSITVDAGATLGGSGTVGAVTTQGGTVDASTLHTSALSLDTMATFDVALDGIVPGVGPGYYSQLSCSGAIDLAGATLVGTVGFDSAAGDQFTVITASGGVTGTFAGLPNGGHLFLSGREFMIAYTSNAVVLTHVAALSTTALAVSGSAPTLGQPVTFTATVTPVDPRSLPPSVGSVVTFMDGATPIGTGVVDRSGQATMTTSSLSVGGHIITAVYNGDHNVGTSTSTPSTVLVAPQAVGALASGQTATIGFWQGPNGQALIQSFDGGPNSTALGNWLSATLPNLYGSSAGANDLAGKTNSQVAAFYLQLFNAKGQKLDAQVFDAALDVYATTTSLGGAYAGRYGFHVTINGVGGSTFNVGSGGAAFGVANNTLLTVFQILEAANSQAVNGVLYGGNKTLCNLANTVFSAINQKGDISS